MVTVECDSKNYNYIFSVNGRYTTAAHNIEEAKKNILVMIEDRMDAAINKRLDSSLVDRFKIDKFEIDMEGNIVDIG